MSRMTPSDAIIDGLLRTGPSAGELGSFDAIARNKNRLHPINARHEQTTAYMALLCLRKALTTPA